MNEKVSVIIPTYKRSELLGRAIESVLNQTYTNIEIIVVDDNEPCSNFRVDTENVVRRYRTNGNVKYVQNNKNLGGALARNEGISKSTGGFVTFLDDDDIYLPEKIKVQANYMLRHQWDLSFTDVRMHNTKDVLVDYREHKYIKSLSNEDLLKWHIMYHLTPTATYMFRREALCAVEGFDDASMGQEFMLMLKCIERGLKIGYIPVALVVQYVHDGERISVGENKLRKEIELFNFKKGYFDYLEPRERQYVEFRHHAVMTVVAKRSGKQGVFLKHLLKAALVSPLYCILTVIDHIRKIRKHQTIDVIDRIDCEAG